MIKRFILLLLFYFSMDFYFLKIYMSFYCGGGYLIYNGWGIL